MNLKDNLDEKTLKELIKIFYVHYKLINKVPEDKINFMGRQVLKLHKREVNNLYEELENV